MQNAAAILNDLIVYIHNSESPYSLCCVYAHVQNYHAAAILNYLIVTIPDHATRVVVVRILHYLL